MSEEFTPQQIRQVLDLELGDNDSGEPTVRGYLLKLLCDVWTEGEGFDGKRPFGNSSWDYDIKIPMLRAGLIGGELDSDGDVVALDDHVADALILAAIAALDAPGHPEPEPAKVIVVEDEDTEIGRFPGGQFEITDAGILRVLQRGEPVLACAAYAWHRVRVDTGDDL